MFAPQRKPNPTPDETSKKGDGFVTHHSAGPPKSQMLRRGPTAGRISLGIRPRHQPASTAHGLGDASTAGGSRTELEARGAAKSGQPRDGGRLAHPIP